MDTSLKNVLGIDLGGYFYRLYHRYVKTDFNVLDEIKRNFIEDISFLKQRFNSEHVIIGGECSRKNNWRLEFYPEYKANRDKKRKNDDESVIEKMKDTKIKFYDWCNHLQVLNIHLLYENTCEGDDVLASFIRNNNHRFNFIIVSDDKDFQQLLNEKNIIQISIDDKKEIIKKNYSDIRFHIALGDSIDNIPNLKYGFGEAKIMKLLETNKFDEWIKDNKLEEKFELNKKLIIMSEIPQHLQTSICKKFDDIISIPPNNDIIAIDKFLQENNIYLDVDNFI